MLSGRYYTAKGKGEKGKKEDGYRRKSWGEECAADPRAKPVGVEPLVGSPLRIVKIRIHRTELILQMLSSAPHKLLFVMRGVDDVCGPIHFVLIQ